MKILEEQEPHPLAWWESGIIYQIYPRSFQDSNGDGVGDLLGIKSRIQHLLDIGVKGVWISPIYKSPMADFGYDISNFTEIEEVFGTLEDFKSLSQALKEKDIKLIMDFVPNHSSDEHEWFIKSVNRQEPYTSYYVWKDAKGFEDSTPTPPNNWVSVFGGSMWEWNKKRGQFYLHQFLKKQPDLNYENPKVLLEVLAALKFWLELGVDGLRVDAVPHLFEDQEFKDEEEDAQRVPEALPDEYRYWLHTQTYNQQPKVLRVLAEMRKLIDTYASEDGKERCMMVEAMIPNLQQLFHYYGDEEGGIADFPFNFEFINRIKKGFNGRDVRNVVEEWFEKMPKGKTANWLVGNHDNSRVSSRFGDFSVDPFNMIIHLLPGSSVTYYGEEIGMEDARISWEETVDPAGCNVGEERYKGFSRDPQRTPMQWNSEKNGGFSSANRTWLPVNENYKEVNVEAQKGVEESHLGIYKKVALLRTRGAFKFGSLETQSTNGGAVFGFSRIYNGTGFLVLANFGDALVTVNAMKEFESVPTNANVYTRSQAFIPETTFVGQRISTLDVAIGAKHSLILDF